MNTSIEATAELSAPTTTAEFEAVRDKALEFAATVTQVKDAEGTELATAVAVLKELKGIIDEVNDLEEAKRKPVNKWLKDIRAFRDELLAKVICERERITGLVNNYQRKQLEDQRERERVAQAERDKAQREAEAAQRKIEQLNNAEITTRDGLLIRNGEVIQLPEVDEVARKRGFTCAERMVSHLEAKMLDAILAAEEAALNVQSASLELSAPTNTPRGLTTRARYDFEIVSPLALAEHRPNLWVWKKEDEVLKFDRAGFIKALNNEAVPHPLLPDEQTQSIAHMTLGIRIYKSVSTHVR